MPSHSLSSVIGHYQRKMQRHPGESEVLKHALSKLSRLEGISIAVLQDTGVGRVVNGLKKSQDEEVAALARELVLKWKEIVANEEEQEQEEEAQAQGQDGQSQDEEDEEGQEVGQENGQQQEEEEEDREEHRPPSPEEDKVADEDGPDENDQPADEPYSPQNFRASPTPPSSPLPPPDNNDDPAQFFPQDSDSDDDKSDDDKEIKEDFSSQEKVEKQRNGHHSHSHHHRDKSKSEHRPEESSHRHHSPSSSLQQSSNSHSSSGHHHKKKAKSSRSDRERSGDVEHHRQRDHHERKKSKKDKSKDRDRESSSSTATATSAHSSSSSSRHKHHKEKKDKDRDRERSKSSSSKHRESSAFDMAMGGGTEEGSSRKKSKKSSKDKERKHSPAPTSASSSNGRHSPAPAPNPVPLGISPNYKPLPPKKSDEEMGRKAAVFTDHDEALSLFMKSKGEKRTAVYSGTKRTGYFGAIPTLHEMCLRVLQEHVDSIEECGGLPFDILQPVLDRASPQTLLRIEQYNPYLIEDTTELWERHCRRHFPKKAREEMETWRDLFERCTEERERKLEGLKSKLQNRYEKERDSQKKTKLAYVGLNAKPPRNVRAAQARNGTAGSTAVANVKRLAAAPMPVAAGPPKKPKMAPMMAKTLKMARGMKGFRR